MDGLATAFMIAMLSLLAKISWDLFCIREALEKGGKFEKKHPGRARCRPAGHAERVPDGRPDPEIAQPLPKVAQRDPRRD